MSSKLTWFVALVYAAIPQVLHAEDGKVCSLNLINPEYSDEVCLDKLQFCAKTPGMIISAVKFRENGTSERQAIKNILWFGSDCRSSYCGWYARNEQFIINTIHNIYTIEEEYDGFRRIVNTKDSSYSIIELCMGDDRLVVYP